MKKVFVLLSGMFVSMSAAHALDWWLQPTICRIDDTRCYGSLGGAGYDDEMWDAVSNCRGMKYVCPDATTSTTDRTPVLMGRYEISQGKGLNSDFDMTALNKAEGCFGVRKTSANGAQASVNGKMVNVYCPGVLDRPDEYLENGEITFDTAHPTCAELAEYGYVATLNSSGNCYGKYYDLSKYYIECGTGLTPTRLIVMNGADVESSTGTTTEKSATDALFEKMYSTSQAQKKQYFNQD